MLFTDVQPRTTTWLWIVGAIFDSLVASIIVAWLLLDGILRDVAFTLVLSLGPIFTALSLFFYWAASRPARYRKLLQCGVRGTATVRHAHLTGTRINGMPVLKLDLEVSVPGRPPYSAHDRVLAYPGTIERDATFDCVVDPRDPQKVVVLRDQGVLADPQTQGSGAYYS